MKINKVGPLTLPLTVFLGGCSLLGQTVIPIPAPKPVTTIQRQVSESFTITTLTSTISFTLKAKPVVGSILFVYKNSELLMIKTVESSSSPEVLQITAGTGGNSLTIGDVLTFTYTIQ